MIKHRYVSGDELISQINDVEFDQWGVIGVNYDFTRQDILETINKDFYWPQSYDLELQGDGLAIDF